MSGSHDNLFGPAAPSRFTGPKVWVPPKSEDGAITVEAFNTQKTLLIKRVVTVSKEDKKRAREEKAQVDQEEEEKRKKTTSQAIIDEEVRQIQELIENLDKERQQSAEAAAAEKAAQGIERDGTEIPQTFAVSSSSSSSKVANAAADEDALQAVSADAMYADQRDAKMSTALYYGQGCFPVDALVSLVTHNRRIKLEECELAFVFGGAWWRNKRFSTVIQLQSFIEHRKPERIDIGPATVPGKGKLRYLVFDTDLEDRSAENPGGYIRMCRCKGSRTVCPLGCWFYMRVAVKCLTYVLRKVLDAKHIMPVSSGRRGVHTWVLDETFVSMTEDERKGVVKRVELLGRPWEYTHPEYTSYMYTYILKPVFVSHYLDGQKLICTQETTRLVLELFAVLGPSKNLVETMQQDLDDQSVITDMIIYMLHQRIADVHHASCLQDRQAAWKNLSRVFSSAHDFRYRMLFTLLYPRLDAAVTTSMTHCIKAPFVVHPDSKRCCVPIPDIETWGPHKAPRISELATSEDEIANPYAWRGGGDEQAKGAVLTDYVNHMTDMLSRAYPYPDFHL